MHKLFDFLWLCFAGYFLIRLVSPFSKTVVYFWWDHKPKHNVWPRACSGGISPLLLACFGPIHGITTHKKKGHTATWIALQEKVVRFFVVDGWFSLCCCSWWFQLGVHGGLNIFFTFNTVFFMVGLVFSSSSSQSFESPAPRTTPTHLCSMIHFSYDAVLSLPCAGFQELVLPQSNLATVKIHRTSIVKSRVSCDLLLASWNISNKKLTPLVWA